MSLLVVMTLNCPPSPFPCVNENLDLKAPLDLGSSFLAGELHRCYIAQKASCCLAARMLGLTGDACSGSLVPPPYSCKLPLRPARACGHHEYPGSWWPLPNGFRVCWWGLLGSLFRKNLQSTDFPYSNIHSRFISWNSFVKKSFFRTFWWYSG